MSRTTTAQLWVKYQTEMYSTSKQRKLGFSVWLTRYRRRRVRRRAQRESRRRNR